jgi:hypothetical protein
MDPLRAGSKRLSARDLYFVGTLQNARKPFPDFVPNHKNPKSPWKMVGFRLTLGLERL